MANFLKTKSFLFVSSCLVVSMLNAAVRPASDESETPAASAHPKAHSDVSADDATAVDATDADAGNDEVPAEAMKAAKPARAATIPDQALRADAFIAGPDWEFDGYVAGGQDSKVRSMFYLNDLLYLNIGSQQGIVTGDKLEIYKRGDKVRDPQTGRFIGYEVRRAAVVRATDRVEDEACAVRIIRTHEAVEIGDLVRRIQ
jgi:hypothetical protein